MFHASYRNIDSVMEKQKDLLRLEPLAVMKG